MPEAIAAEAIAAPETSRFFENIVHFARILRRAGLSLGPGRTMLAIAAVKAAGIGSRDDLYWILHASFVNRRSDRDIFDQAFHVFWRNPHLLQRLMALLLPSLSVEAENQATPAIAPRLAEALGGPRPPGEAAREAAGEEIALDAAMTYSDRDLLQTMDFEKMSAAEMAEAKAAIADLRLPIAALPTRRFAPGRRGPVDPRASLRAALRQSDAIPLRFRRRRRRPPPLVILCDISGSMNRYSRIFLHFSHALSAERDRVHVFLFGTRLTNITRDLRQRDVDAALDRVAAHVVDWSGGTRIGHCLDLFNRLWGRRVLGQGAIALLISDGLDRDDAAGLDAAMERLRKSCRRLIWLNPLLRFSGYETKSLGARAMIDHVDDFRPIHNLQSLRDLAAILSRPETVLREPEPERNRHDA